MCVCVCLDFLVNKQTGLEGKNQNQGRFSRHKLGSCVRSERGCYSTIGRKQPTDAFKCQDGDQWDHVMVILPIDSRFISLVLRQLVFRQNWANKCFVQKKLSRIDKSSAFRFGYFFQVAKHVSEKSTKTGATTTNRFTFLAGPKSREWRNDALHGYNGDSFPHSLRVGPGSFLTSSCVPEFFHQAQERSLGLGFSRRTS